MDFATLAYLRDESKWTGLYRLLLIEIELYATRNSHTSYPSIDTLAAHLGKTPRHTQTLLRTLVTAGAVKVVRGGGRHHTNCYQLCDLPETVNSTSGFSGERMHSGRRNGEIGDRETLKPTSPEVIRKERKERDGLLAQPASQAFSRETLPIDAPGGDDFISFNGVYGHCRRCGEQHQRGACVLPRQAGTLARLPAQGAP
jgi:hypothetical protein